MKLTENGAWTSILDIHRTRIQRAAIQDVRRDADARIVVEAGAGAQDGAAILGEALGRSDARRQIVI